MIGIGDEHEGKVRQHADPGKILQRAVRQLVVDRSRHRVAARQRWHSVVPSGVARATYAAAVGAAGAGLRLDDDLLAELGASRSATRRAVRSTLPPGVKPWAMVMAPSDRRLRERRRNAQRRTIRQSPRGG